MTGTACSYTSSLALRPLDQPNWQRNLIALPGFGAEFFNLRRKQNANGKQKVLFLLLAYSVIEEDLGQKISTEFLPLANKKITEEKGIMILLLKP